VSACQDEIFFVRRYNRGKFWQKYSEGVDQVTKKELLPRVRRVYASEGAEIEKILARYLVSRLQRR